MLSLDCLPVAGARDAVLPVFHREEPRKVPGPAGERMDLDVSYDLDRNVAQLGGSSLVFHCHHYNATLQRTIEEGLGEPAFELLAAAAQEATRAQLQALAGETRGPAVLEVAATLFARAGFGTLDLSRLSPQGGEAFCGSSHYALCWLAKFGERTTPACSFAAGYLGAALQVAHDLAPERVRVVETECMARGDARCHFALEVR